MGRTGLRKKEVKKHEGRGKSLSIITKEVIDILKKAEAPISIKDLGDITCKRRCYDVLLVLEALGIINRLKKGIVLKNLTRTVSDADSISCENTEPCTSNNTNISFDDQIIAHYFPDLA